MALFDMKNRLAEEWRNIEGSNPKLAKVVTKFMDNGELKSFDYYKGYRKALFNLRNFLS